MCKFITYQLLYIQKLLKIYYENFTFIYNGNFNKTIYLLIVSMTLQILHHKILQKISENNNKYSLTLFNYDVLTLSYIMKYNKYIEMTHVSELQAAIIEITNPQFNHNTLDVKSSQKLQIARIGKSKCYLQKYL